MYRCRLLRDGLLRALRQYVLTNRCEDTFTPARWCRAGHMSHNPSVRVTGFVYLFRTCGLFVRPSPRKRNPKSPPRSVTAHSTADCDSSAPPLLPNRTHASLQIASAPLSRTSCGTCSVALPCEGAISTVPSVCPQATQRALGLRHTHDTVGDVAVALPPIRLARAESTPRASAAHAPPERSHRTAPRRVRRPSAQRGVSH